VSVFDVWRPVCSDGFDDVDAIIACRDIGFGYVCTLCACSAITMTRRETITSAKN